MWRLEPSGTTDALPQNYLAFLCRALGLPSARLDANFGANHHRDATLAQKLVHLMPFKNGIRRTLCCVARKRNWLSMHCVVVAAVLEIFFQSAPHLKASIITDGNVTEIK